MTVYQSETQRVTQLNRALESKHLRYVLRMTSLRSRGDRAGEAEKIRGGRGTAGGRGKGRKQES